MIFFKDGLVYAVEFSHRSGRDLLNVAKKRTNIIPIIEDARHPHKYRMLIGMVDTIFADVAQPDQARIVALNAHHFLKTGGNFVISIKVRKNSIYKNIYFFLYRLVVLILQQHPKQYLLMKSKNFKVKNLNLKNKLHLNHMNVIMLLLLVFISILNPCFLFIHFNKLFFRPIGKSKNKEDTEE